MMEPMSASERGVGVAGVSAGCSHLMAGEANTSRRMEPALAGGSAANNDSTAGLERGSLGALRVVCRETSIRVRLRQVSARMEIWWARFIERISLPCADARDTLRWSAVRRPIMQRRDEQA